MLFIKIYQIVLLKMCCGCCYLSIVLTVPWVGLHSLIVAFPGHTHLNFGSVCNSSRSMDG